MNLRPTLLGTGLINARQLHNSILFVTAAGLRIRVGPESVGVVPDSECTVSDEQGANHIAGSLDVQASRRVGLSGIIRGGR